MESLKICRSDENSSFALYMTGLEEIKSTGPSTSYKVEEKTNLHARSLHRAGYDFMALANGSPELKPYVRPNKYNNWSVDFSNRYAVRAFSRALLSQYYGITYWEFPETYLCPPVPGRADYLHYLADLLEEANGGQLPDGKKIKTLDIGTGANCIYPLLGHAIYQWDFIAADIDPVSIAAARQIIAHNSSHTTAVECRLQPDPELIFSGIIQPGELYDLVMCNPPFHSSMEQARRGSVAKWKNLGIEKATDSALNFAGQQTELMCPGGEAAFIGRMIAESRLFSKSCYWFTSLVSKKSNLPALYEALESAGASTVKTVEMAQGTKFSRFLAWTFLDEINQMNWRQTRWV